MTSQEFIKIRKDAGLLLDQLSKIIKVTERTIRRYETEEIPISGPVQTLMELIEQDII